MRINRNATKVLVVFLVIIFLPSFIYVSLGASSMAAGILAACFIIMLAAGGLRLPLGILKIPVLLFISAFVMHFSYYSFQGGVSLKQTLSVILLGLMFLCGGLLSIEINKVSNNDLIVVLNILSAVIVFLGCFSIVGSVDILNYEKYAKSIFPFSEPSHYAITISGVLLATGFYLSSATRWLLLLSVLLFSVLYPSTLLLLLLVVMLFSYYVHSYFKLTLVLFCVVGLIFVLPYVGVDTSYYEDRLKFDGSTSNLTALVYMQGWEDAYNALLHTGWIGLGFQRLGSLEPGEFGIRIYEIVDRYMNREDGGFLAAKIIGEFGVLGLVFLLFYVVALCSSVFYNRKFIKAYQKDRNKALELFPVSSVLGCSLIVAFSIEVFARGYGYFSPGILLAMVSIFLVTRKRKGHSCRHTSDYA